MHEASIAAPLLRLVLESAEDQSAKQGKPLHVNEVRIRAGLLQCLEAHTLSGIFSIMAEGTLAEGARLVVESEPMRGACPDCGQDVQITKRSFECPNCGGEQVDWTGGKELYIASIIVRPEEEQAEVKKSEAPGREEKALRTAE